jgi:hypothetical protein
LKGGADGRNEWVTGGIRQDSEELRGHRGWDEQKMPKGQNLGRKRAFLCLQSYWEWGLLCTPDQVAVWMEGNLSLIAGIGKPLYSRSTVGIFLRGQSYDSWTARNFKQL